MMLKDPSASLNWCIFFFSSRRRHTRSLRDWSSDVCSSDLVRRTAVERADIDHARDVLALQPHGEIGRASCRERVSFLAVGGRLVKKLLMGTGIITSTA